MTRNNCARWLLSHDNFCILTHLRPDGDTIGSSAALCLGLRQLGKTAHVLCNPEITEKYKPLHQGLTKTTAEDGDTIVSVDIASAALLPQNAKALLERIALRIDHHYSAASFTPEELVDHTAGACGEIIYDVLMEMGVKLDTAIAIPLYTAVSTDTGCFRYPNTTAHTLRVAAACHDTGADLHCVNQLLFDTNSLAKLRIQGWIAENTRVFGDGKLAVCAIPLAVEQELGVNEDDMDNISGFPRSIEGVCMSATLRQTADGGIKVSVRAVPGYDASAVCAMFGGGGHKGAAGVSMRMPLPDAASLIENAMLELYQ